MSSRDLFDEVAPDYSGISSDTYQLWAGVAVDRVNSETFGGLYPFAVVLMTAHMIAMRDRGQTSGSSMPAGGATGNPTSIDEGDQALSFSESAQQKANSASDASLSQTTFGRQFIELREEVAGGPYRPGD